ncbi:hypothetical protein [Variovorax sp. HW608]|uniref:hypothetical protein n=1 Tax=Variovorax sp. HW608 TaxID=1034889 RepID=UPI0012FDE161|nr:hypothetical protein [Variovorax sp. HW608]
MTMRLPVDFVIYNLELSGGLKLLLYNGYQPSKVPAAESSSVKRYSSLDGSYEYVLASDGRRVITYASNQKKFPALQLVINKFETSQKKVLIDFLETFRPCSGGGTGVFSCDKNEVLFKDFIQENLR